MIPDSFFTIGSTHRVCEDYATHTQKSAFLSDGCSGATHTDVGARLLVHTAAKQTTTIQTAALRALDAGTLLFGGWDKAFAALHATLYTLTFNGKDILFEGIGDGGLLRIDSKTGDACLELWEVAPSPQGNAPPYPVYFTDPVMKGLFLNSFEGDPVKGAVYFKKGDVFEVDLLSPEGAHLSRAWDPSEKWDIAIAFSDGIASFPEGFGEFLNSLVKRVMSTPRTRAWLRRCVPAALRDAAKKNPRNVPQDDLSAAAVWIDREEGAE